MPASRGLSQAPRTRIRETTGSCCHRKDQHCEPRTSAWVACVGDDGLSQLGWFRRGVGETKTGHANATQGHC